MPGSVKISVLSVILIASLAGSTAARSRLAGDLDGNYKVDFKDLWIFAWQWLDPICLVSGCEADLDGVNGVNMGDLALLAKNWRIEKPHLLISEFMASNASVPPLEEGDLLDADDDSSDWIEIYNPTDVAANLDGWYLIYEDEDDDLTRWQFPAVELEPGEFLVVFASGKNRLDPNELHTNFELDKGGGYLALMAADGNTIAHEYAPEYPQQLTDVSYGLTHYVKTLAPIGATASYHVPTISDAALGTDWTTPNFNDSGWESGPTSLGFGSGVGTDVQSQMQNVNASLLTRIEFDLEEGESSLFDTLTMRMKYEDGFVAYLNGQEVARRNAPALVKWNSTAESNRPIEHSLVFEEINLMASLYVLQSGKNVLAIHGLNDSANDPNFLILPELAAASNMSVPQYFTQATPRNLNVPGAMGVVSEVWFSHKRGFYDAPFQLTLSTGDDSAEIRYTLDGSLPTIIHGTTYLGPFDVNETSTIRAVAVKPGWLDSDVETHTYIFLSDVISQSPNGEAPGSGWPSGDINGQYMNYGMDPEIVEPPSSYADLIDDALLAIPTISLVTDLDNLFDPSNGIYVNAYQDGIGWERPASMELIYPDGSDGFQIDMGLRIRGGWSRMDNNPKHAFRCFFRSKYGDSRLRYPLFGEEGVDEFDKVDLRAEQNYSWAFCNDTRSTFVHEVFTRDTQGAMGQPYTRSRYYHLYLNGHYWGLFQTQERSEARYARSYMGGEVEDYDVVKTSDEHTAGYTDGNMEAYTRLYNAAVVTGFASNADYFRVQGKNPDGMDNPAYEKLVDIDNVIAYNLMCYYFGGIDYPIGLKDDSKLMINNLYGIYNRNNPDGFKFFIHDAEHTFGLREGAGGADRTRFLNFGTTYTGPSYFNPVWLHQKLSENLEYNIAFADAVYKHMFNDGALTQDKCFDRLNNRLVQVESAIVAESARWGDAIRPFGEGGSWVCGTRSGDPELYRPATKAHWDSSINRVISWLTGRTDTVFNWIKNRTWLQYPSIVPPELRINNSPHHGGYISMGGILSMTNPNGSGTIYCTLDGSDPRLIGGAVNPAASIMGGSTIEIINKTTHVKARVKYGSTWSALNEAVYADERIAGSLRITEIMYHPQYTGDPNDPNTEFIEMKNTGLTTLNLNLVKFTQGIHFTFPDMELDPDECVVVVKSQSAFEAQYGTSVNIAGEYTGSSLANNGERIRLEDAIGRTILDFEYGDGWRPITNGDGFSLTIIDPTNSDPNSWSRKDSWRASVYRSGSPGADDSGILPNPGAVVINEVMAHSKLGPDWIELHNTTNEEINIGGWFLSDNSRSEPNLMKYRIADGTMIDSYGYKVFYEDANFSSPNDPGCNVPFALSENCEDVCLSSYLDTNGFLTGCRDVENFGASQTNVSMGRYYKSSTGNFNFVAMDYNTPDVNNAYPKVGPVVINEIMYNPPTGNQNEEYIELHNITGALVTLYRYDKSTPWKFTDGIDYTFSASSVVTIKAYGYLILAKDLTAFTLRYGGMPSDVRVIDGYTGRLSNAGERLQIAMPGDVDEFGIRQYIRIDRVTYSDGLHPEDVPGSADLWPREADGLGKSLSRKVPTDYGNDVDNWQAATPSPGLANP